MGMTSKQFMDMSLPHQLRWVYFEGEHLTSIRYYKHKINLYLIDNFIVEVFYNHKEDRIERVELLDFSSNRLNFYTDQVRLPKDVRSEFLK